MRFTVSEKQEIIHMVVRSEIGVNRTLREIGLNKSTFYNWYNAYTEKGVEGLLPNKRCVNRQWNSIPQVQKNLVVKLALDYSHLSSRELAYKITDEQQIFISESSVYRILKSFDLIQSPAFEVITVKDKFENPTKRVNEMWQTDFTQFLVVDWGWYYLSTVLDDYSRYILSYTLSTTMKAQDAEKTLKIALAKAEIEKVKVYHKPRLLSDNGPAYHSRELAEFLTERRIKHIHGAPYHPMTQGKIERWHRSMKNVVKLQHYYSPSELESAISAWVEYYNNQRYHESLDNVTPADVYFGRDKEVIKKRNRLKEKTLALRRQQHLIRAGV